MASDVPLHPSEVAKPFFGVKFGREAAKHWDIFYKNHENRFFKDRQWCDQEFSILRRREADPRLLLGLEVGCGVGNFLFPTLAKNDQLFLYACDFSPRAIECVKANPQYDPDRMTVFVADITEENSALPLNQYIRPRSLDFVSCLFVLSAIPPTGMTKAIESMSSVLKSGGLLLFRDYALHDSAQTNFHTRASNTWTMPSRLDPELAWYVRGDKTLTYFFNVDELVKLMASAGLEPDGGPEAVQIVERQTTNAKLGISMVRLFLQGQFVKI